MTTDQPQSLKSLGALYPYQFQTTPLGINVAKGWMPIFTRLSADVDRILGEDKRGFHWSEVKEKFGSARFYYEFKGRKPDLRLDLQMPSGVLSQTVPFERQIRSDQDRSFEQINAEVRRLAMRAEVATRRVCLVCGKEGSQDVDAGYALVLCAEHQAQRREPKGLPDFWANLLNEKDKEAIEMPRRESIEEIERVLAKHRKDDEVGDDC